MASAIAARKALDAAAKNDPALADVYLDMNVARLCLHAKSLVDFHWVLSVGMTLLAAMFLYIMTLPTIPVDENQRQQQALTVVYVVAAIAMGVCAVVVYFVRKDVRVLFDAAAKQYPQLLLTDADVAAAKTK